MELTPESMVDFLKSAYPDRKQSDMAAIEGMLDDLEACGITALGSLEEMLVKNADAFLTRERESPPNGEAGSRFATVGVVRTSLLIEFPDFADAKAAGVLGLSEPEIAPLEGDEERLLQVVHRLDGNRNDIYLVHLSATDYENTGSGGSANFAAIIRSTDDDPNKTALPWAWQTGETERSIYIRLAEAFSNSPPLPGVRVEFDAAVQWYVDRIREQHGSEPTSTEIKGKLAIRYFDACVEVLSTVNACLEAANRSVTSGSAVDDLPHRGGSISEFMSRGTTTDQGFAGLYASFSEACVEARQIASHLIAGDSIQAEMVLMTGFSEEMLDQVATAKAILSVQFGSTPTSFLQGVEEANAYMKNPPTDGNIYGSSLLRPPRS